MLLLYIHYLLYYSTQENVCEDCRLVNPKRATRISVMGAQNVKINTTYQLPNFFYKISCENEEYTSKVIECTLSPQWKEHFIFYRISDEDSSLTIQVKYIIIIRLANDSIVIKLI